MAGTGREWAWGERMGARVDFVARIRSTTRGFEWCGVGDGCNSREFFVTVREGSGVRNWCDFRSQLTLFSRTSYIVLMLSGIETEHCLL